MTWSTWFALTGAVLFALWLLVRELNRRGLGPTVDRVLFGDPDALRFDQPIHCRTTQKHNGGTS